MIVHKFGGTSAGSAKVLHPKTIRPVLQRKFENSHREDIFRLGVKEKVATISVVAMAGWNSQRNSIASRAFAALGERETRVIAVAQTATERSVSFCIPEDQLADTVRFLHRELGLKDGQSHRS